MLIKNINVIFGFAKTGLYSYFCIFSMMHHRDNPLFPTTDTPYDTLIFNDMFNDFRNYLKENDFKLCPKGFTYEELSFTDDSSKIIEFINKYYGNKDWKVTITTAEIQSFIDRGNACAVGVFWNKLLIGLVIVETYDVFYKGTIRKAGCGDYLTLHPKFRNKGMATTLVAKAMDKAGELGAKFTFFHSHTKLHVDCSITYTLYNLPLTNIPLMAGASRKNACNLRASNTKLITPTIEHVKSLNDQPYSIYIKYDDKCIQSMLKYDNIYTDGNSVLRFVTLYNNLNGFRIKTATLIDYVKPNNVQLFNSALNDLREKGFDLVTIINDKTLNDIISAFPFEKNSEMYTYMGNILPKAKVNEIHLNLR